MWPIYWPAERNELIIARVCDTHGINKLLGTFPSCFVFRREEDLFLDLVHLLVEDHDGAPVHLGEDY